MSDPLLELLRKAKGLRWLLWPLVLLAVAIGFDFKTPRAHFAELERADQAIIARQEAIVRRADSMEVEHRQIMAYLRALSVAECIDRPRRDWMLMGLECDNLLRRGRMP